jgi:purine-binding chemotaxis protein CheW
MFRTFLRLRTLRACRWRALKIAGVLNLRGRIVTVIDLANRLQLDTPRDATAPMVIGIERGAESFGILVDRVGEVLSLARRRSRPGPDQS